MEEKMIISMPERFGETIDSLQKAINDAGGSPTMSDVMNMPVLAFLGTICCSNGIRFYHDKTYTLAKPDKSAKVKTRPPISGQSNVVEELHVFTDEEDS